MKLSVVMIALNEEARIADAIQSAAFADEVVVVDSGSSDQTVAIARSLGARVEHQAWLGFARQKQKAVDLAHHDWVFVLDSDERITPALQAEIQTVLAQPRCAGYQVARLNYFFGKPVRHGGFYPDYSVRLFDRRHGHFADVPVHETVTVAGPVGRLKNPMLHRACDTVAQFVAKASHYATLAKKDNFFKALIRPPWMFFKIYFLRLGILDGKPGFVIAAMYSQYTFWKYVE